MITVKAPITIYQFDEERYKRIEQSIAAIQTDVASMKAVLQEVLESRQALLDQMQQRLDTSVSGLQKVITDVTAQTTKKEG